MFSGTFETRCRTISENCEGCVIHTIAKNHVETVCLLSKGDVKSKKIRVEFSLEDMDTDGFKKGATYNAIRDWIKEEKVKAIEDAMRHFQMI